MPPLRCRWLLCAVLAAAAAVTAAAPRQKPQPYLDWLTLHQEDPSAPERRILVTVVPDPRHDYVRHPVPGSPWSPAPVGSGPPLQPGETAEETQFDGLPAVRPRPTQQLQPTQLQPSQQQPPQLQPTQQQPLPETSASPQQHTPALDTDADNHLNEADQQRQRPVPSWAQHLSADWLDRHPVVSAYLDSWQDGDDRQDEASDPQQQLQEDGLPPQLPQWSDTLPSNWVDSLPPDWSDGMPPDWSDTLPEGWADTLPPDWADNLPPSWLAQRPVVNGFWPGGIPGPDQPLEQPPQQQQQQNQQQENQQKQHGQQEAQKQDELQDDERQEQQREQHEVQIQEKQQQDHPQSEQQQHEQHEEQQELKQEQNEEQQQQEQEQDQSQQTWQQLQEQELEEEQQQERQQQEGHQQVQEEQQVPPPWKKQAIFAEAAADLLAGRPRLASPSEAATTEVCSGEMTAATENTPATTTTTAATAASKSTAAADTTPTATSEPTTRPPAAEPAPAPSAASAAGSPESSAPSPGRRAVPLLFRLVRPLLTWQRRPSGQRLLRYLADPLNPRHWVHRRRRRRSSSSSSAEAAATHTGEYSPGRILSKVKHAHSFVSVWKSLVVARGTKLIGFLFLWIPHSDHQGSNSKGQPQFPG